MIPEVLNGVEARALIGPVKLFQTTLEKTLFYVPEGIGMLKQRRIKSTQKLTDMAVHILLA